MTMVGTIWNPVHRIEWVAFLPRQCLTQEIEQERLSQVKAPELLAGRKIHLAYPARRALSHAAMAFLEVVAGRLDQVS